MTRAAVAVRSGAFGSPETKHGDTLMGATSGKAWAADVRPSSTAVSAASEASTATVRLIGESGRSVFVGTYSSTVALSMVTGVWGTSECGPCLPVGTCAM